MLLFYGLSDFYWLRTSIEIVRLLRSLIGTLFLSEPILDFTKKIWPLLTYWLSVTSLWALTSVHWLIGLSRLLGRFRFVLFSLVCLCHYFPKEREVTLPCSYRSTKSPTVQQTVISHRNCSVSGPRMLLKIYSAISCWVCDLWFEKNWYIVLLSTDAITIITKTKQGWINCWRRHQRGS